MPRLEDPTRKEAAIAAPYTLRKLTDVEDSAPSSDSASTRRMRFAGDDLDAERTGVSYHRVKPDMRQGFAHKHDEAEEIYVVLAGSGRVKLDDEILEIEPLDAIRVAPGVIRMFEAGAEGLELLAFGARHERDGDLIFDWWTD